MARSFSYMCKIFVALSKKHQKTKIFLSFVNVAYSLNTVAKVLQIKYQT